MITIGLRYCPSGALYYVSLMCYTCDMYQNINNARKVSDFVRYDLYIGRYLMSLLRIETYENQWMLWFHGFFFGVLVSMVKCRISTIWNAIEWCYTRLFITRVASWGSDRRKWLFSEVRGGIWTPHWPVLIKISADKRPLNQLTVKKIFFSLIIKTFCH